MACNVRRIEHGKLVAHAVQPLYASPECLSGSHAGAANLKPAALVPSPRPALSITADCSSAKTPLSAVADGGEGGSAGPSGEGAAACKKDVSFVAGIAAMLRNPHHAAFFATTLLMGIG